MMMNMTGKHWSIFGAFLVAIGISIGSLGDWQEATRPLFVAGLLGQIGAFFMAMNSDKPSA